MRYPRVDARPPRERDGKRYLGSYVRVAGEWRRLSPSDMGDLLFFMLDDQFEALKRPHPFLALLPKRP